MIDYIYATFILPRKSIHLPHYPVFKSIKASNKFYDLLKTCNFYVEYGSGGSTLAAAKLQKKFQSYESSRSFLERLKIDLSQLYSGSSGQFGCFLLEYGAIRSWGIPFPFCITRLVCASKMKEYSKPHWIGTGYVPDLILIDGRFRVSCTLKNLASIKGHSFNLVVDDYSERPEYRVIEKYSNLIEIVGSTAFFSGVKTLQGIEDDILMHELDFR